MATRSNHKAMARYLGGQLAKDKRGKVSKHMELYDAPIWVLEMLAAGRVSKINWELLYADVEAARKTPLPSYMVETFTEENRWTQMERASFPPVAGALCGDESGASIRVGASGG